MENRNLRAASEKNQGEESQVALEVSALNTEIEELRQRLMEAKERVPHVSCHEAAKVGSDARVVITYVSDSDMECLWETCPKR